VVQQDSRRRRGSISPGDGGAIGAAAAFRRPAQTVVRCVEAASGRRPGEWAQAVAMAQRRLPVNAPAGRSYSSRPAGAPKRLRGKEDL
jgi:hypothetical protein